MSNDLISIIDMIINNAEEYGLPIDYIAIGRHLMENLAESISTRIDDFGLTIKSIAKYRDIPIRETEIESVVVKYMVNPQTWAEIKHDI